MGYLQCGGLLLGMRSRRSVGRVSLSMVTWRRWSRCLESQGPQLSMGCTACSNLIKPGLCAWLLAICMSKFTSRLPFAEGESGAQIGESHCTGYWLLVIYRYVTNHCGLGGLKTFHLYYAHKFCRSGIRMWNSRDSLSLLHGV